MLRLVQAFLDGQARDFMSGDLHALASAYLFPCPVRDAEGREFVVSAAADVVAPMAALREACLARALTGVSAEIVSIELARARRFRVWMRWRHHYPDRIEVGAHDVTYHLTQFFGTTLAIERAEYSHPPAPGSARMDRAS